MQLKKRTRLNDYPEWQQDNIRIARDFLENEDDYLALPTSMTLTNIK